MAHRRPAELGVAHLKILQEVITLSVFVPFAVFYLREPIKLDYLERPRGGVAPGPILAVDERGPRCYRLSRKRR